MKIFLLIIFGLAVSSGDSGSSGSGSNSYYSDSSSEHGHEPASLTNSPHDWPILSPINPTTSAYSVISLIRNNGARMLNKDDFELVKNVQVSKSTKFTAYDTVLRRLSRKYEIVVDPINGLYVISPIVLGEGSFGRVNLAQDIFNGVLLVAKSLRMSKLNHKSLDREVRGLKAVGKLRSIVKSRYEIVIIMDYIPGKTLYHLNYNSWSLNAIVMLRDKILGAVRNFHEKFWLTHGDLHAKNVVVDWPNGEPDYVDVHIVNLCNVYLLDFGEVRELNNQEAGEDIEVAVRFINVVLKAKRNSRWIDNKKIWNQINT